jgi:fructokinase
MNGMIAANTYSSWFETVEPNVNPSFLKTRFRAGFPVSASQIPPDCVVAQYGFHELWFVQTMKIISLGEILWDLVDGREFLGGAPLNFALHAAQLGHDVFMVSAVGDDDRGKRALAEISARWLRTDFIARVPGHPTGTVSVHISNPGLPSYTIHRPAAYDFPALDSEQLNALSSPPPDWIYLGTLQQLSPAANHVLQMVLDSAPKARRCYDVNLRRDSYTPALVRGLLSAANVLKLNEDEVGEVAALMPILGSESQGGLEQFCRHAVLAFNLEAVCVTRGADGCVLLLGDEYVTAAAPKVTVADTIGAGDAFCAALVHGIGRNWPAAQIAAFACGVGALVASRAGGSPPWHPEDIVALP